MRDEINDRVPEQWEPECRWGWVRRQFWIGQPLIKRLARNPSFAALCDQTRSTSGVIRLPIYEMPDLPRPMHELTLSCLTGLLLGRVCSAALAPPLPHSESSPRLALGGRTFRLPAACSTARRYAAHFWAKRSAGSAWSPSLGPFGDEGCGLECGFRVRGCSGTQKMIPLSELECRQLCRMWIRGRSRGSPPHATSASLAPHRPRYITWDRGGLHVLWG